MRVRKSPVRSTEVMRATIQHFRIPIDMLLDRIRDPEIVIARHVAWYLERKRGLSFPQIGAYYNRDHSTIHYGCKHMDERVAAGDLRYAPAIAAIEATLQHEIALAVQRDVQEVKQLACCPTCGTDVIELQRQIALIHRRLSDIGVKP